MRRLFSTFAHGWPGVGLLLMRLVVGLTLSINGFQKLQTGHSIQLAILNTLAIVDGALLIAGLWTPIAGSLVVVLAFWGLVAQNAGVCPVVLSSTLGVGLALVGPGGWSFDSWLFGWKRIDIDR